MIEDPSDAIKRLPDFLNKARNINPERSFVEAVAGGPNHDWTAPMLDIIGMVYPSMDKELRKKGLLQCLGFLDMLNYFNSQDNVELINEPWLAADIVINRPLYWCGYGQYCNLLSHNKRWEEVSEKRISARSEFWLSIAVSRPKYSSLEVRMKYYKEYPDIMDRTMDAIAGISYTHAVHANQNENIAIEDYIKKSLSKYDPLLHESIREKMKEKKWIELEGSV